MPTSTKNTNIPYSQQEALAIGYAQYALMHTLTQQLRANYPAAFLHAAAAASGYLPLPTSMMAAAAAVAAAASANSNSNGNKMSTAEKFRERRKPQQQQQHPESDNNNNHIQKTNPSANDQPYQRETYQTLLESSRLLGQQQQQKLLKPVPIDLRKHNGTNRTNDSSKIHNTILASTGINFKTLYFSRPHSIKLSIFIVIIVGITAKFTFEFKSTQISEY